MTAQELFEKHSHLATRGSWIKRHFVMTEDQFIAALSEAIEGGHLQPLVSLSESPIQEGGLERQENAGWPVVDREKWSDWLTVGRLKEIIVDMPDDALVFSQRVEDKYFEKHGWKGLRRPCPEYPDDEDGDQYLNVWYGLKYKDIDEHLYLTLHY